MYYSRTIHAHIDFYSFETSCHFWTWTDRENWGKCDNASMNTQQCSLPDDGDDVEETVKTNSGSQSVVVRSSFVYK